MRKIKSTKLYYIYNSVFCDICESMEDTDFREMVLEEVNKLFPRIKITSAEFDGLFYGSFLKFDRELAILQAVYNYYVKDFTTFQTLTYLIQVSFKFVTHISDKELMELTKCNKSEVDYAYRALGFDEVA